MIANASAPPAGCVERCGRRLPRRSKPEPDGDPHGPRRTSPRAGHTNRDRVPFSGHESAETPVPRPTAHVPRDPHGGPEKPVGWDTGPVRAGDVKGTAVPRRRIASPWTALVAHADCDPILSTRDPMPIIATRRSLIGRPWSRKPTDRTGTRPGPPSSRTGVRRRRSRSTDAGTPRSRAGDSLRSNGPTRRLRRGSGSARSPNPRSRGEGPFAARRRPKASSRGGRHGFRERPPTRSRASPDERGHALRIRKSIGRETRPQGGDPGPRRPPGRSLVAEGSTGIR